MINEEFIKVWSHYLSRLLSDRFYELILPLIVLGISGSPIITTAVLMVQKAASILFAIPVGTFIERINVVTVAWVANFVYGCLLFFLSYIFARGIGDLWLITIIIFLLGFAGLVIQIAQQAMIPRIVSRERLLSANNLLEAADAIVTFIGPALGGYLLATYGGSTTLIICGTLYLAAMLLLIFIKYNHQPTVKKQQTLVKSVRTFIEESKAGMGHLFINTPQMLITLTAISLSFSTTFIILSVIMHADLTLSFSETQIGLLLSCAGIGNLLGVFLMPRFKQMNWLPFLGILMAVSGVGIILLTTSHFYLMCLGMVLFDGALSMGFVVQISVQQGITPDHLIARVRSAVHVLTSLTGMLATFLAGVITEWNTYLPFLIGTTILSLLSLLLFKYRHNGVRLSEMRPLD